MFLQKREFWSAYDLLVNNFSVIWINADLASEGGNLCKASVAYLQWISAKFNVFFKPSL